MLKPSKQFILDFNKVMRYCEATKEDAAFERKWLEENQHRLQEVEASYRLMADKII